jgi:hypothetical protein
VQSPSPLVLGVAGVGLVFIWSAVHGANVATTIRDLLAGHTTAAPGTDPTLVATTAGAIGGAVAADSAGAAGALGGSTLADLGQSHSAAGNRANGQLQAAGRGWTGAQWNALDRLWTRESGWNNLARNPSSGAYGIAQFLDGTWAGVGGTKTSDPTLQIRYGLAYITNRYGSPVNAWAHETSAGWY